MLNLSTAENFKVTLCHLSDALFHIFTAFSCITLTLTYSLSSQMVLDLVLVYTIHVPAWPLGQIEDLMAAKKKRRIYHVMT